MAMRRFFPLALVAQLLLSAPALAQLDRPRDPMEYFFNLSLGDLKTEAEEARAAGKQALFVMYVRDDCQYCERMKAHILSLQRVQQYYRKNFAVLAIDLRGAVPITDFTGPTITEKEFARTQGVKFTPVIIFYDFNGTPLTRVDGEVRTLDEFMLLGDFVTSGSYRTRSFADYKRFLDTRKGS